MESSSLILTLPIWVEPFVARYRLPLQSDDARMEFVVSLARENIKRKSGGPFAAAIFNSDTGELISLGVNRVTALNCSIAHAEMMAIGLAQQRLETFDLGAPGLPACMLVTSTEPCAMCLGAIPWSGIKKLVCGATDADARSVGFDEGTKPPAWKDDLIRRNISVSVEVCRTAAATVLREYAEGGGIVYNGSSGAAPRLAPTDN